MGAVAVQYLAAHDPCASGKEEERKRGDTVLIGVETREQKRKHGVHRRFPAIDPTLVARDTAKLEGLVDEIVGRLTADERLPIRSFRNPSQTECWPAYCSTEEVPSLCDRQAADRTSNDVYCAE
jgi:hypothetical protein